MARKPWTGEEQVSESFIARHADNNGLRAQAASAGGGNWTVGDVVSELHGGNRALAEKMLAERGITNPTKTQINSQMRNIQRWQKGERGESGQVHKPSKGAQDALNKIGRRAAHGNESARVSINGQASVNGYKRHRSIELELTPDEAAEFFDAIDSGDMAGAWDMLADAYHVGELHAYDAEIGIDWS